MLKQEIKISDKSTEENKDMNISSNTNDNKDISNANIAHKEERKLPGIKRQVLKIKPKNIESVFKKDNSNENENCDDKSKVIEENCIPAPKFNIDLNVFRNDVVVKSDLHDKDDEYKDKEKPSLLKSNETEGSDTKKNTKAHMKDINEELKNTDNSMSKSKINPFSEIINRDTGLIKGIGFTCTDPTSKPIQFKINKEYDINTSDDDAKEFESVSKIKHSYFQAQQESTFKSLFKLTINKIIIIDTSQNKLLYDDGYVTLEEDTENGKKYIIYRNRIGKILFHGLINNKYSEVSVQPSSISGHVVVFRAIADITTNKVNTLFIRVNDQEAAEKMKITASKLISLK
jgi:hypothetical protein